MTDPLAFLDQLATRQDELAHGVAEVDARLAGARLARVAPVQVGDVGFHGLGPVPDVESVRPVDVVVPPEPPADLEDGVRRAISAGTGSSESRPGPTAVPADEEPEEPADLREHQVTLESAELGSLVQLPVRIGSQWSLVPVAAARIRRPVAGPGGVLELFEGFDPRGATSYEVEATLLRLERSGDGQETGLEVGPLIPTIVARGWTFRALPWTNEVKRGFVRALGLPSGFASIPANSRDRSDGRLHAGEALVVLAVDPESGRSPEATDGDGTEAPDGAATPAEPARDEDGDAVPDRAGRDPTAVGAALRQAWDRFVARGGEGSFEEFARAVSAFEQESPEAAALGARQFFEAFLEHERTHVAAPAAELSDGSPEEEEPRAVERSRAPFTVRFDRTRLRRKYKHAPDFGVHERFGRQSLERFEEALVGHVAAAADRYMVNDRGQRLVAHVGRGRVVWTTTEGAFVNAYRATPDQLRHAWAQPEWRMP